MRGIQHERRGMSPEGPSLDTFFNRRERRSGLRPRDAAYLVVAVWLIAVVAWGILEHFIDRDNFPTVWLGMWWALQTVTTVGYGDAVPTTTAGRAVASVLLLGGLAFISVVTATITSGFVSRAQQQRAAAGEDPTLQQLAALDTRLAALDDRLTHVDERLERILDRVGQRPDS
jgi:voltage-gated potassium channel